MMMSYSHPINSQKGMLPFWFSFWGVCPTVYKPLS